MERRRPSWTEGRNPTGYLVRGDEPISVWPNIKNLDTFLLYRGREDYTHALIEWQRPLSGEIQPYRERYRMPQPLPKPPEWAQYWEKAK